MPVVCKDGVLYGDGEVLKNISPDDFKRILQLKKVEIDNYLKHKHRLSHGFKALFLSREMSIVLTAEGISFFTRTKQNPTQLTVEHLRSRFQRFWNIAVDAGYQPSIVRTPTGFDDDPYGYWLTLK